MLVSRCYISTMLGDVLLVTCLIVMTLRFASSQQTIAEAIGQRPELSLIKQYMAGTDIFNRLRLTTTSYTFFAPTNRAFTNISEQARNIFVNPSTPTSYFNSIFSYHATLSLVQVSTMSDSNPVLPIQMLAVGAPRLFLVYSSGETFVNGARFVEANVPGITNGILHIIDHVLYEPRVATNAYTYIQTTAPTFADPQQQTVMFSALLNAYKYAVSTTRQIVPSAGNDVVDSILNSGDGVYMTAFVPHDAALTEFRNYNLDRYTGVIKGSDPILLQKVIESHVIPRMPYHTDVLEMLASSGTPVQAIQGNVRVYRLNDGLYVSNNCVQAKITLGNITALNGPVHMIDNLLGFVYMDAFTQIKRDTLWLYEFHGSVQATTADVLKLFVIPDSVTGKIPANKKYTIFAPIRTAYDNKHGRLNDFSQDQRTLDSQMLQLMLPGVVEITQMLNGTQLPTLLPGQFMKFYQYGDNHYVEVNYVRARIVHAGVCVRNGIIHKVDEIVGVPCCSIFEEIIYNRQLSDLRETIVNNALETLLRTSQNITMFAPVDFSEMRNSKVGLSLINNRLNSKRMRNVMLRHIVDGALFLDSLGTTTTISTQYDQIQLSTTSKQEYFVMIGTQRIQVLRANIRTKNGVMHIIDRVIFDPDDFQTGQLAKSLATGQHYRNTNALLSFACVVVFVRGFSSSLAGR